jgi:membrane-associated protein
MDALKQLLDFFLHLDKHLTEIVTQYDTWTYALLFLIIFVETGVVVMPFLPGDSLLFAAGAISAASDNSLNVWIVILLLFIAAALGDTANYGIGKAIGPRAFSGSIRFLKKEYLEKTQLFYEKHGGRTIIYARFIPIIRTFAPFVAGVGTMRYGRFIAYNVIGGLIWVMAFTLAGYFFGNIPAVKKNFTFVILGIIVVSLLPPVIEYLRARKSPRSV